MYKSNKQKKIFYDKYLKKSFTQISNESGLKKLNKPGFSGSAILNKIDIPKLRNGLVKSICFSRT